MSPESIVSRMASPITGKVDPLKTLPCRVCGEACHGLPSDALSVDHWLCTPIGQQIESERMAPKQQCQYCGGEGGFTSHAWGEYPEQWVLCRKCAGTGHVIRGRRGQT